MKLSTFGYYLMPFLIGLMTPVESTANLSLTFVCLVTLIGFKIRCDLNQ